MSSDQHVRWPLTRLDRVATVKARIGWKALKASEYTDDGYIFLSTPNIKGSTIDFDDVNYISEHRYMESPELMLQPGDVLLAKDGSTLGITALVGDMPGPATVNGSIAVIRPFGIDPSFLRWVLEGHAIQSLIQQMKDGMGVPHLFQWDIRRFPIPLPPLEEQRRIANYLDDQTTRIDQAIQLRLRSAELVRERFDATRESAIRGLGGNSRHVAGWLGNVNEEWTVRRLGSLATFKAGAGFPDSYQGLASGDLPFVKVADLSRVDDAMELSGASNWVSRTTARSLGAKVAKPGTIVFPKVGAALLTNSRAVLGIDSVFDNNVMGLSFHTGDHRFWLHVLSCLDMAEVANPGPVPSLSAQSVSGLLLPLPPMEQQIKISRDLDSHARVLQEVLLANQSAVSLLVEHKKALVTAAVAGTFDVFSASSC